MPSTARHKEYKKDQLDPWPVVGVGVTWSTLKGTVLRHLRELCTVQRALEKMAKARVPSSDVKVEESGVVVGGGILEVFSKEMPGKDEGEAACD